LEQFKGVLENVNGVVWGIPLIVLLMGTGLFMTLRLGALQIKHLGRALRYVVINEESGHGEISAFGALCTALAATIGTGNIVGVATAMTIGGPGALFWMVVSAFLGMATKYAEGLLAVKYRVIERDGHTLGGPFYYIERGMGKSFIWLAKLFAFFGAFAGLLGIGTIVQVNGISSAVNGFFDPANENTIRLFGHDYSITVAVTAVVVSFLTGLVIIGGIKRIAGVSMVVVPFMAMSYVYVSLLILICNYKEIPGSILEIFTEAFGFRAAAGGVIGAIMVSMKIGIARGVFSNEAGLGSAPIAAAAARTKEPARQGLVSMTGTFIDTIVMCNITGLTIMVTNSWNLGMEGVQVTLNTFSTGLPFDPVAGSFILMASLVFFAFSTIIGWNYYGERCLEYLVGGRGGALILYRWLYIIAVLAGPFMTLSAVWTIADILNGLMAIPNLIALLALSGVVVTETKIFLRRTI